MSSVTRLLAPASWPKLLALGLSGVAGYGVLAVAAEFGITGLTQRLRQRLARSASDGVERPVAGAPG